MSYFCSKLSVNKDVAFQNLCEITLQYGYSPVDLQHIFRAPFPKNTYGGSLLYFAIFKSLRSKHSLLIVQRKCSNDMLYKFSKLISFLNHFARGFFSTKCPEPHNSHYAEAVVRPQPATLLKKRLSCFPVNFAKFFRTFKNTCFYRTPTAAASDYVTKLFTASNLERYNKILTL